MTIALNFDTYEYVKRSKELGANEALAAYQAEQFEQIISKVTTEVRAEIREEIYSKELTTKKDIEVVKLELQKDIKDFEIRLQKEISNTRIQTLIWIGVNTAFMLGIIAKGFHWW